MATRIKTLLFLATVCFHNAISALTGYDCSSTTIIEYDVSTNDLLPPCQTITASDKYFVKVIELPEQSIVGYRCKITFTETLVDVNGLTKIVSNGTEPITRAACLEAHKTKYVHLSGDLVYVKANKTVNHQVSIGDHYDFDAGSRNKTRKYRYVKTYDITLSEYVGTVDLQQNVIRFNDNVVCDYEDNTCSDDQSGLLAWKPVETERYSTIYAGTINFAIVSQSLTRSRELGYAVLTSKLVQKIFLLLTYGELSINGKRAYRTELPNVYVVFSEYDGVIRGWEYDGRLKHVYSQPNYSKHVDVVEVGKQRCISENNELYTRLKSLPTFSTVLFDEIGTMGIKINKRLGLFSIQKCSKEDVVVRKTDQCYREIPVEDKQERPRFLNAESRVLMDHGTEVPCDHQYQYNTSKDPQLLWVEYPAQLLETDVEVPQNETSTETSYASNATLASTVESSTERLKTPSVQKSSVGPACADWIKVLGLVSLCLWVFVGVGRLFKLVVCCVPKNYQREGDSSSKFFSEGTNCFKRNKNKVAVEKQPEPAVSYVV